VVPADPSLSVTPEGAEAARVGAVLPGAALGLHWAATLLAARCVREPSEGDRGAGAGVPKNLRHLATDGLDGAGGLLELDPSHGVMMWLTGW
jgi:hypothetical protein